MISSRINVLLSDIILHEYPHLTFGLYKRQEKYSASALERGFLPHYRVNGALVVERSTAVVSCWVDVDVVYLQCLRFVGKAAAPIATFYVDRLR